VRGDGRAEEWAPLPGGERAIVAPEKVRDYLLSLEHPVGRGKARFFAGIGFTHSGWEALQRALLDIARGGPARQLSGSAHGQKYEVRAMLEGPNGRTALVITIWIIPGGEDSPRLVTAYPGGAK
jgi:hypothetical protein